MSYIDMFFKDKHGKWVIVQFPNPLLLTWLLLVIIVIIVQDTVLRTDIEQLQKAVLFAWAYFEIIAGASPFRRALGTVLLIMSSVSYFV